MSNHAPLRRLIKALEARHKGLSPDSESLKQSTKALVETNDIMLMTETLNDIKGDRETLRELLGAMDAEINEITVARQRLQNLPQPAVNLPFELLAQIFEMACIINGKEFDRILRRTRGAISLTCTKWRQTAKRTPRLWAYIRARLSASGDSHPRARLLFLEMQRAMAVPLSLKLNADGIALEEQFRLAVQRCAYLHITGNVHNLHDVLFQYSSVASLPFLHTLILDQITESIDIDLAPMASLTNLWVDENLRFPANPKPLLLGPEITTNNIIRLHIKGGISSTTVINFINACHRKLEHLFWECPRDNESPPRLPSLHSFEALHDLYATGRFSLTCLRDIDAPNLKRLGIECTGETLISPDLLLPMPAKHPDIQFLEIKMDLPDGTLINYFQSYTNLEELRLHRCLSGTLAQRLGETGTGQVLPKLAVVQVLALYNQYVVPADHIEQVLSLRSAREPTKPFMLRVCDARPRPSRRLQEIMRMYCGSVTVQIKTLSRPTWDWSKLFV